MTGFLIGQPHDVPYMWPFKSTLSLQEGWPVGPFGCRIDGWIRISVVFCPGVRIWDGTGDHDGMVMAERLVVGVGRERSGAGKSSY